MPISEKEESAHGMMVDFLKFAMIPVCPSTVRKLMKDDFGYTDREMSRALCIGFERQTITLADGLKLQAGEQ